MKYWLLYIFILPLLIAAFIYEPQKTCFLEITGHISDHDMVYNFRFLLFQCIKQFFNSKASSEILLFDSGLIYFDWIFYFYFFCVLSNNSNFFPVFRVYNSRVCTEIFHTVSFDRTNGHHLAKMD